MSEGDLLVRGYFADKGLKASIATVTLAAREGQRMHGLHDVSAMMLAQGLTAATLLASLQKDQTRVNLQLECDGPLRGLFVDAGASGYLRGYVKNPYLDVEGNRGPMRWRPALGNSGFLSVLKDLGEHEFYRSSVELKAMDFAPDLEGYFAASEQVATRTALAVERDGAEPLGAVAGVLVQALPDGDTAALEQLGQTLSARLEEQVKRTDAHGLLQALLPGFEPAGSVPLAWRCGCSKQKVLLALSSLGKAELMDMLATKGGAAADCQFCGKRHEATAADLQALIAASPA
jgi:molecular chaperone Hsp33